MTAARFSETIGPARRDNHPGTMRRQHPGKACPSPEEAPVTSATSPVRSKSCCACMTWVIVGLHPFLSYLDAK